MEINPLVEGYHGEVTENIQHHVSWKNPDLKRIIRLRLLTDRDFPFYDVSYCHGQLKDGSYVDVQLPFSQLPKRWYRKAIVMQNVTMQSQFVQHKLIMTISELA